MSVLSTLRHVSGCASGKTIYASAKASYGGDSQIVATGPPCHLRDSRLNQERFFKFSNNTYRFFHFLYVYSPS